MHVKEIIEKYIWKGMCGVSTQGLMPNDKDILVEQCTQDIEQCLPSVGELTDVIVENLGIFCNITGMAGSIHALMLRGIRGEEKGNE